MRDSHIAWTHHTHNEWEGCEKIRPGCKHCYAEDLHERRFHKGIWGPADSTPRRLTSAANRNRPWTWNADAMLRGERDRVFSLSQGDVFEEHPSTGPWREQLLLRAEQTSDLDWLLLTKRTDRIALGVPGHWHQHWPQHVWLGASVENQEVADSELPKLRAVRGPLVHFASFEPLLGPVRVGDVLADRVPGSIFWGIVGGESALPTHPARRCDVDWIGDLVQDLTSVGAVPFVKQCGDHVTRCTAEGVATIVPLRARKGGDPLEWEPHLRVRSVPQPAYQYVPCTACGRDAVLSEPDPVTPMRRVPAPHVAPCGRPCLGARVLLGKPCKGRQCARCARSRRKS